MGRVKELWQEECDKRFRERVEQIMKDGYSLIEAEEMAADEQADIDHANEQFGVGA